MIGTAAGPRLASLVSLVLLAGPAPGCTDSLECPGLEVTVEAVELPAGLPIEDVKLSARLTEDGSPVAGEALSFRFGNAAAGSSTTDSDGVAVLVIGDDIAEDFVFAATALRADDYTVSRSRNVTCGAEATAPFDLAGLPLGVRHDGIDG